MEYNDEFSFSEFLSGDSELGLSNLYLDSYFFYVPSRSSWDNWFDFLSDK